MKGLSSFSRAGTFALCLQHSTEQKSPQEEPYYQVSGYTVLKHQHTVPTYGVTTQYAKAADTSKVLSKEDKKYIQKVIGTLL